MAERVGRVDELGVGVTVRPVCTFLCRGAISSYWLGVHEAELAEAVRNWPFIPDGQEAFTRYLTASGRRRPGQCRSVSDSR